MLGKNLKVGTRILMGFLIIVLLIGCLTGFIFISNQTIISGMGAVRTNTEFAALSDRLITEFNTAMLYSRQEFIKYTDDSYTLVQQEYEKCKQTIGQMQELIANTPLLSGYAEDIESITAQLNIWGGLLEQVHENNLSRSLVITVCRSLDGKLSSLMDDFMKATITLPATEGEEESTAVYTMWLEQQITKDKNNLFTLITAYRMNFNSMLMDLNLSEYDNNIKRANLVNTSLNNYINTRAHDAGAPIAENIKARMDEYGVQIDKYADITSQTMENISTAQNSETQVLQLLSDFAEQTNYQVEDRIGSSIQQSYWTLAVSIVISVGSIAVSIVLALGITRDIRKPINSMVEAATSLSQGNIDITLDNTRKDEFGLLIGAFQSLIDSTREQIHALEEVAAGNMTVQVQPRCEKDTLNQSMVTMIDKNNSVLLSIREAAKEVASGAFQISKGSMTLSQASTEQASAIEQITESIESVDRQTRSNASHAQHANELADNANSSARKGDTLMKDMVVAMGEINESSRNISKVIKVIDDIAFQTNILALNAAVEAARAGQYGKGFAVVAQEVRSLAEKSANAAQETTLLIENSISKAQAGGKIVDDAAKMLRQIVQATMDVARLVSEISTASNIQAEGLAQVMQSIEQVAQVVQTNSANSEETASAAQELTSMSETLRKMVEGYNLRDQAASAPISYAKYDDDQDDVQIPDEQAMQLTVAQEDELDEAQASDAQEDFGKY